jgi:hypothetical protein
MRQRSGWLRACVAFAVLVVLVGMGVAMLGAEDAAFTSQPVTAVATTEAPSSEFTPAEQRLVGLLPPGYTGSSCTPAINPFPDSIASLDCIDDRNTDTPDYARFTLYNNLESLTADFYASAESMTVSPCPGGNASPGTWDYGSKPGGRVVCGMIEDRADIAWTRDAQLLLATINGAPSLDDLYQWWQRYGGASGS